MLDWFDYHGHMCVSFEVLGLSIFDFLVSIGHAAQHNTVKAEILALNLFGAKIKTHKYILCVQSHQK